MGGKTGCDHSCDLGIPNGIEDRGNPSPPLAQQNGRESESYSYDVYSQLPTTHMMFSSPVPVGTRRTSPTRRGTPLHLFLIQSCLPQDLLYLLQQRLVLCIPLLCHAESVSPQHLAALVAGTARKCTFGPVRARPGIKLCKRLARERCTESILGGSSGVTRSSQKGFCFGA